MLTKQHSLLMFMVICSSMYVMSVTQYVCLSVILNFVVCFSIIVSLCFIGQSFIVTTPWPGKNGPLKQNAVKCTVYNTIQWHLHSII